MMKFVIAAALVAVPTVPALAQQTAHVAYKADELVTASGRAALQRRVKVAVVQVCGTDRVPGSMLVNSKVRACYRTATASARPQVERAIALAARGSEVASAR
jgi:UrcA family protein